MPGSRKIDLLLTGIVALFAGCGGKPSPVAEPAPEFAPAPAIDPLERGAESAAGRTSGGSPGDRIAVLEQRVHFEYNQWSLTPAARAILDAKVGALGAEPGIRIRIEGHADDRGSDEYNLILSRQRAESAKHYLVGLGIAADRIEVTGFGEEQPLDPAENETAWAVNRRAEFRILSGGPTL